MAQNTLGLNLYIKLSKKYLYSPSRPGGQIVASLYILMVAVVVGMSYKLKERKVRGVRGVEEESEEGKQLIKSSSVCFTEGRGTSSTHVSASNKFVKRKVDV